MSEWRLAGYLTTYVWGALRAALSSEGIPVELE